MMAVTITAVVFVLTSCLVRPTSEGKKLVRVHGSNLTEKQLRENAKRQQKNAKAIINNACGSLLHHDSFFSAWQEPAPGEGFFMRRTDSKNDIARGKRTSCSEQYVTFDVGAAFFMAKHNISCSVGHDGLLRFDVPGSSGKTDAIKVTCATRQVELIAQDDTLRIATFEEDGSTYTSSINAQGDIDSHGIRIIEGISAEKLQQFKHALRDRNFINLAKDLKVSIAGTGLLLPATAAYLVSDKVLMLGTAVYSGKALALAGVVGTGVIYVAAPVAVVAILAGGIWAGVKMDKEYRDTVLALREIVRQNLAGS